MQLKHRIIPGDVRAVVLYCTPTILGVAAQVIAQLFRPGESMPLETFSDRFFVGLVVIGVPAALIGIIWVGLAVVGAVGIVMAHGPSSKKGKTVLITLAVALTAAIYLIVEMRQSQENVRQRFSEGRVIRNEAHVYS